MVRNYMTKWKRKIKVETLQGFQIMIFWVTILFVGVFGLICYFMK
jgi:hypothetical protein